MEPAVQSGEEVIEQRSDWAQRQGLTNPIRFQGQYHDHETGLHYNRYRYYDPRVGAVCQQRPDQLCGWAESICVCAESGGVG
ncbi:RHS repeat-associated core domain-containing protein [Pseudomonas lundensis]|uniref:RHS repeat-associated core domain-containing protein n=1 Tax=Pseudomonas lundensis TaxID=86185 RepID=UPI00257E4BD4|nr:RHS repeat-associated core domain-containing protein [Pseudomonas lundensis]